MKTNSSFPDRKEYPFTSRFFTIDGYNMHYIDEGQGEVLLFVHGTPSWSFDFRHCISALRTSYRCIAVDHIGFGLSDKPKNYPYSALQHSKNLKTFILEKGLQNITLLAHDFGGPIGLHSAIHYPKRFMRIALLNTWFWSSENDKTFQKLKKVLRSPLLPLLYKYFNFSARYILPSSFGKKKLSSTLRKQYTSPFSTPDERHGCIGFAKSLLNEQEWFESLWQKKTLIEHVPALFIWGMKDPVLSPTYLEKGSSAFLNKRIVKLEDCGHFPQEEEADKTVKALKRFLLEMPQKV